MKITVAVALLACVAFLVVSAPAPASEEALPENMSFKAVAHYIGNGWAVPVEKDSDRCCKYPQNKEQPGGCNNGLLLSAYSMGSGFGILSQ